MKPSIKSRMYGSRRQWAVTTRMGTAAYLTWDAAVNAVRAYWWWEEWSAR
jgi:hypothetical protein